MHAPRTLVWSVERSLLRLLLPQVADRHPAGVVVDDRAAVPAVADVADLGALRRFGVRDCGRRTHETNGQGQSIKCFHDDASLFASNVWYAKKVFESI